MIIRYEDIAVSLDCLMPVFDFCSVHIDAADKTYINQKSILKWKTDPLFGFQLADEIADLARRYGYGDHDLSNSSKLLWPAYREFSRLGYKPAIGLQTIKDKTFKKIL